MLSGGNVTTRYLEREITPQNLKIVCYSYAITSLSQYYHFLDKKITYSYQYLFGILFRDYIDRKIQNLPSPIVD